MEGFTEIKLLACGVEDKPVTPGEVTDHYRDENNQVKVTVPEDIGMVKVNTQKGEYLLNHWDNSQWAGLFTEKDISLVFKLTGQSTAVLAYCQV